LVAIYCIPHQLKFQIPEIDEEFASGKFHDEIQRLSEHHEQFPRCKFMEKRV